MGGLIMAEPKPCDIPEQTDNLVITCMDHRYHKVIREILLRDYEVDIDEADRLILAGSSMAVADRSLLPQIKKSHDLHDISTVWVIDHSDCGGFGGLEKYDGDESKEQQAHFESMARAQQAIHRVLPQLVVTSFLVNFDGEKVLPPVLSAK
jgi:carbonic anhydrase